MNKKTLRIRLSLFLDSIVNWTLGLLGWEFAKDLTEDVPECFKGLTADDVMLLYSSLLTTQARAMQGEFYGEEQGICYQWSSKLAKTRLAGARIYQIVSALAMDWKYSNAPGLETPYPVPRPSLALGRWSPEPDNVSISQLDLRISLIAHMLRKLKALYLQMGGVS